MWPGGGGKSEFLVKVGRKSDFLLILACEWFALKVGLRPPAAAVLCKVGTEPSNRDASRVDLRNVLQTDI